MRSAGCLKYRWIGGIERRPEAEYLGYANRGHVYLSLVEALGCRKITGCDDNFTNLHLLCMLQAAPFVIAKRNALLQVSTWKCLLFPFHSPGWSTGGLSRCVYSRPRRGITSRRRNLITCLSLVLQCMPRRHRTPPLTDPRPCCVRPKLPNQCAQPEPSTSLASDLPCRRATRLAARPRVQSSGSKAALAPAHPITQRRVATSQAREPPQLAPRRPYAGPNSP